ncbi:DNA repair protein SWI5 homolog [Ctenocephalides felis]|uniref:DNA repair protein SWI5 homolog n=1 Tax=Ctenocephalides felis TaxID=7515 RepID=UPI000E6E435E|nr:DNA repair protein SWI5 homolog [Ctenocephalides felis]
MESFQDQFDNLKKEEAEIDQKILEFQNKQKNGQFVDKQTYMKLLHEYNDLKDAAQTMIGALANIKGVTVAAVHNQYNLPTDD